jgi:2-oxo-4-hydroxy-4-carboxy-5-ureidoimidazoline decarboxylase
MAKVALGSLNTAGEAAFIDALGEVYERAPWVAKAVCGQRPFATLAALHTAMIAAVRAAPVEQRLALIRGHPDLAGKAARAGAMTADSQAEQASAGLACLSEAEFAHFHRLNGAYRERFGIPFIICARRHSKDSILQQFERRLHNNAAEETETALVEIFRIAALRLDQRLEAADHLEVHGRLSTHVLDTHSGRPAAGVPVELLEVATNGEQRVITRAKTNRDGRTDVPLLAGQPLPIGRYELRFHIGEYFAGSTARLDDPPFLDVVPVRFAVANPEGDYHVPLLVTPWSYSTYRGS